MTKVTKPLAGVKHIDYDLFTSYHLGEVFYIKSKRNSMLSKIQIAEMNAIEFWKDINNKINTNPIDIINNGFTIRTKEDLDNSRCKAYNIVVK